MSGQSRNNPVSYANVQVSSDHTRNRKRSVSKDRMTSENNPDHKRSKPEICGTSGKDVSTGSEQDMINYDTLELNPTSQVEFDDDALAGSEGQNTESKKNISEIAPKANAPNNISDTTASKKVSIWSVDDKLAIQGTSSSHKENTSNLREEASQSFTCRVCRREIAEHANQENIFQCCSCEFTNSEEVDLQIHSYSHVSKTKCYICKKKHAIGNSHSSEHKCHKCKKKFQCRTLFYEHFHDHSECYRKRCWVCRRKFDDHNTEDFWFVCCVCGFKSIFHFDLLSHIALHLPRFFCRLCEEEYSTEEKLLHGREFACFDCPEKFECQTHLEGHYKAHHKYSSDNCRICKGSVNEHFIGSEEKEFQCCNKECLKRFDSKISLQDHLYSHLRDIRCVTCRKQFKSEKAVHGHYAYCKRLPFKCEICETRFYTSDILRAHHSVNHRQA